MMTPRLSLRWLVASSLVVAAIIVGSCNLHNPGVTAPAEALSYPSALALSREEAGAPKWLYVANSNFDLRYNSGSMQSYDLAALDGVLQASGCRTFGNTRITIDDAGVTTRIDAGTREFTDNTHYALASLLDAGVPDASDASGDAGDASALVDAAGSLDASLIVLPGDYDVTANYGNARGFLCDGEDPAGYEGCCFDNAAKLSVILHSRLEIDSFAVGVVVAPQNDRVYVPISSRNELVYFDVLNDGVHDGMLDCGGATRCRRGPDRTSDDNVPDDDFPGQLSEITIGTLGELLPPGAQDDVLPPKQPIDASQVYLATTHELGGVGLFVVPWLGDPDPVTKLRPNGVPKLDATVRGLGQRPRSVMADPRSNFLYVTSAGEAYVSRVGVRINPNDVPGRVGPRELLYESSRVTVTGVSQANDLRDLAIDPADPNRIYVLIRGTQESVGFLDLDATLPSTNARLIDEVRIGAGPSKMILIQQDGRTFLLVTCYDSKAVYVIDAATHLLVAVVRSFSGPFSMVYDASRKLLHVADFRASIMRVVDLEGLTNRDAPPPRIVATIGSPQFEGALQ